MIEPRDRYFDDWTEGEVFETEPHLMTEERILSFAEEFDPQPFHVDTEAAEASIYGGIIASGWHTGSVMMRHMTEFLGPSSMGSPGIDKLRWTAPVRPNDQLRMQLTVLETRPSTSKPDRGIIRLLQEVLNQNDDVVMTVEATIFMQRRA